MYEKLRNFRTIQPGVVSLVLKYAQNSNENCHEISRREHCAFRRYRAKSRGGAKLAPPPGPDRVKLEFIELYEQNPLEIFPPFFFFTILKGKSTPKLNQF